VWTTDVVTGLVDRVNVQPRPPRRFGTAGPITSLFGKVWESEHHVFAAEGATGGQQAGRCKTWVIQIEPPETYSTDFRLKCWSLMKERSTQAGVTGIGRGGSKHAKPLRYQTTSLWRRQPKNSCSRKAYSRKDGGGGLCAGATNPTSGSYGTMNTEARCDRIGVFLRYGGMIQKWRHFRTRK
jgi:hypothetical protein